MNRAQRAGSAEPDVRSLRTTVTTTGSANEEGDVPPTLRPARWRAFRATVWEYWKKDGRHDLPWRKTTDPYKILVSEVMLQQTQVPRVIEKYKEFLRAFPNVRRLAQAPLSDVLKVWSGMGYNRRAKYLRNAAEVIVRGYGGRVPKAAIVLRKLPGVGPYTAGAVRVFAFNEPDTLIETNIRAAFIHHFFSYPPIHYDRGVLGDIRDTDILPIAEKMAERQDPREWHWALMDYGAHIKKLHGNPARRSAHYTRQSKFEGSLRQVRGEILRQLMKGEPPEVKPRGVERRMVRQALEGLVRDGLIENKKGKWGIV